MNLDPAALWHPVANSDDATDRHVFHGQLLGRELAVWRADDGYINVWENRCLHRGLRLSVGLNEGQELKCAYHGWRYSSRTGDCTYIPAHPADAPARTVCNRTFPAIERYGLIWSTTSAGVAASTSWPEVLPLEEGTPFALRGITVNAPPALVLDRLMGYHFEPSERLGGQGAAVEVTESSMFRVGLRSRIGEAESSIVFFVQPCDSNRTVIRGVLTQAPTESSRTEVLRHHNLRLSRLRDTIEQITSDAPRPEPMDPVFDRIAPKLAEVPPLSADGRRAPVRVTVARKWSTAQDVAALELVALDGQLRACPPGSHIDVHLPNGLVRQYSLTNGPGELASYVIGVKREPDSRGGSEYLHDSLRVGDVLAISDPHNSFVLRRDAVHTVLIAGGIGITPLLSMAQALQQGGLDHELHYFARGEAHLAFTDILERLGESVFTHLGLSPEDTTDALVEIVGTHAAAEQLYVCGPSPMLEATLRIAADASWPDSAVHFEHFRNMQPVDDSSRFEISLARSALTLKVEAGETILSVLRRNRIAIDSSCEQGACGTCVATVIDGIPDHQDVCLNKTEQEAGDQMMTCVSRALSDRLILDL